MLSKSFVLFVINVKPFTKQNAAMSMSASEPGRPFLRRSPHISAAFSKTLKSILPIPKELHQDSKSAIQFPGNIYSHRAGTQIIFARLHGYDKRGSGI